MHDTLFGDPDISRWPGVHTVAFEIWTRRGSTRILHASQLHRRAVGIKLTLLWLALVENQLRLSICAYAVFGEQIGRLHARASSGYAVRLRGYTAAACRTLLWRYFGLLFCPGRAS